MIQNTSIETFKVLENIQNEDQKSVIMALNSLGGATDSEIASYLGEIDPINSKKYRPRRTELYNNNLVINIGKRTCRISNRTTNVWSVNTFEKKKEIASSLNPTQMSTIINKLSCASKFQRDKIRQILDRLDEGTFYG